MKKIFLDTNVWLRFLIGDQEAQYEVCKKLIALNEEGKFKIYTSTIVLLEIIYTLLSFYRVQKKTIISDVKAILASRNLTLIEKTDFQKALALYQKHNIKLADCLIASQLPKNVVLCTYDWDFKKIKNIVSLTPKEVIKKLNLPTDA